MNKLLAPGEVLISEHLKGFSAVCAPPMATLEAIGKFLSQFGPFAQVRLNGFRERLNFLAPVKTFPTRYLVLGLDGWTFLLTDMHKANCGVEAFAVSRAIECKALSVLLRPEHREIQIFENGKKVRHVQSLLDGERWYYREEGPLQPFENRTEYLKRSKKNRLGVDLVRSYFTSYAGVEIPDWIKWPFSVVVGVERSLKDLRVPVRTFKTLIDL